MMLRSLSLRSRLMAAAVLVEVIMLSVLVVNSVRLTQGRMVEQAELRMRDVALALNVSLAAPLAQRNYTALQEMLDGIRTSEGIDYLVLFDSEGKMVAVSGWDTRQPLPGVDKKFGAGYDGTYDRFNTELAVKFAGQNLGNLRYGVSLSVLKQARQDLIWQGLSIAVVAIILSVVLLAMLGYWLTRSLGTLASASREVAAGNLDLVLPVWGADEIGQLTHAFNQMTMALKDRVRALSESEANLAAILNNIPDMVWLKDAEGRYQAVNEAFEKISGRSREEVVGKKDQELWSTEWAQKYVDQDREVIRTGQPMRVEEAYQKADGTRWLDAVKAPVVDWNGRVVGTAGIARDVSERKRSEVEMANLNRLYSMLSQANEAVVRLRGRDELLQEICRIAVEKGRFRMAWIGFLEPDSRRVVPVASWGHVDGYLTKLGIALNDQRTGWGPVATAIREGRRVIVTDIAGNPMMTPWREECLKRGYRSHGAFPLSEAGQVIGAFALYSEDGHFFSEDIIKLLDDLCADVSFALDFVAEGRRRELAEKEIRKLNTELEQRVTDRTRQLEAANKELEAFSYSVSHDLRAPLRSIDGFSQILLKNYAGLMDDTGKDYLGRVCRASQRMGDLIDDMLKLSRVARSELRYEEVDLSLMARSIAEELQEREPERVVEFSLAAGVKVRGDAKLLAIVMDNLMGNAWKFTSKQAVARIEFGTTRHQGEEAVFVRDNGAGFDMAYVHKLFGAFQRLHGMSEFEGTGIGLATVQRIIHRHGGRVWAEGAPGQGATFYFTCNPKKGQEAA